MLCGRLLLHGELARPDLFDEIGKRGIDRFASSAFNPVKPCILQRHDGLRASACATAFLGGDKRMLSPTSPRAVLAYHTPFLQTNNMIIEPLKHAWFTWIEQRTGSPIDQGFKTAINNMVNTKGAVIFRSASNPDVIANGGQTILCRGDENDLPWGCQKTDAFGAMSLGFLTN